MARKSKNDIGKVEQGFSLRAPDANTVELVGDFTEWRLHPISLSQDAEGVWRGNVELTPGEYRYRFLVDGQWRDDPESRRRVPNPFGGQDSILEVPEKNLEAGRKHPIRGQLQSEDSINGGLERRSLC